VFETRNTWEGGLVRFTLIGFDVSYNLVSGNLNGSKVSRMTCPRVMELSGRLKASPCMFELYAAQSTQYNIFSSLVFLQSGPVLIGLE